MVFFPFVVKVSPSIILHFPEGFSPSSGQGQGPPGVVAWLADRKIRPDQGLLS